MGRSSEAFDDARLATIDDLLYVKAHWRMGQAVMANGDVTGALLSFERAMNLEPNNGALRKEIEMARARMAREEEEERRRSEKTKDAEPMPPPSSSNARMSVG